MKGIWNHRRQLLGVCAVLVLGASASLMAHMKLVKSEPAADSTVSASVKQIQVWFTQAPDMKVSKLELKGASGPVKLAPVHAMNDKSLMAMVETDLPNGAYTISWQSAGEDGHVQKGELAFTLKRTQ